MIFGAIQSYLLRKRITGRERCSLPNNSLNSLVIGPGEQLQSLPLIHDIKIARLVCFDPGLASFAVGIGRKHSASVKVGYALDREC
jgi:hypothetical protein